MVQMLSMLGFVALFASALITAPASTVHAQAFPSFSCDAPGANLQTMIDHAADGATIFFGGNCDDGPYIISRKNINLRGFSSGGTLSAPEGFAVVALFFAHARLSRLEINGTGAFNGIEVTGSTLETDDVLVRDSTAVGIQLRNNSTAFIFNSLIEDSGNVGIAVTDSSSADIGTTGPEESQSITGNVWGVLVDANSSITLRKNFIYNNDTGVVCGPSGALTVAEVQDFTRPDVGPPLPNLLNVQIELGCHVREFVDDPEIPS